MICGVRQAFVAGKRAAIAHRLQGGPPPVPDCGPYAHRRRAYFAIGVDRANRLIDQLEGDTL